MEAECLFYGGGLHDVDAKAMAKVKVLDVHPTKPWLATADEHDRVVVWDYARHDVLRHLRPNGFGAGADGGGAPAFGAVRALRWYDADTLWWSARCHGGGDGGGAASALCCLIVQGDHELQLHHLLTGETTHIAAGSGGAGGTSSGSSAAAAAAAGSNKVSFTCVEPVSAALLAIGCSDGAIRVWDWARDACVRALRTHKDRVAVTHLVSAHPDAAWEPRAERAPRLRLVSRGDDAALLLWDMPHAALLSGAAPAAAATDSKSGGAAAAVPLEKRRDDKDCATLSYCAATDTLTALLARRRAGQANEMHLSSWDLAARSGGGGGSGGAAVPLAARGKVSRSKGGVAHACVDHAALPQGAIAACGRDARVHIMAMLGGGGGGGGVAADLDGADAADDPSQSSPYAVVAALPLTALVSGLPEKLKLYALAAHPLRRHLLFVGSNVGAFVLALSRAGAAGDAAAAAAVPASHCAHPAWGPTTLLGLARGSGGGGGSGELAKYVVSWGEDRGGRALQEEAAPGGALRSRSVTNDSTGRLSDDNGGGGSGGGGDAAAAALAAAGDKLLPDGSGRYVAAVSRAAREYRIMTFIEGEIALLESGQCLDFAWIGASTAAGATHDSGAGGSGAAFALLVDINAAAARRERAKAAGGSGLSPRSAAQFVPEIPALSIRRIASGSSGGGDVVSEVGIVDLADGALPVRLHGSGGPLLCLHVREPGVASPSRAAAAATAASASPAMTSALSPVPASGGAAAAPGAPKPMFAGLTLVPTVAALPGAQCRFYRWDAGGGGGGGSGARTAQPVGASFVATCVAWDAAGTRCAVARGAEVRLLSLTRGGSGGGDSLRRAGGFTLAPAEPVEALAWVAGSLFATTPSSVWAATISGGMGGSSGGGGGGAAHVELIKLAANDALAPPPARGWPRGHSRPVPVCRPVGALAVLGLFKGGLLMRSARGGCSIIPLDQACLRIALLAGAGRGADAAAVAANALVRSAHDNAAVLLMRAGHTACALDLPGLSAAAAAELLAYGGGGDGGGSSGSGREGDEVNEDAIAAAADALSTRQRREVLVDATGGCCCSELPGAAAAPLLLRKGLGDGDALLARLLASLAAQQ